jgi:hypothetical protein
VNHIPQFSLYLPVLPFLNLEDQRVFWRAKKKLGSGKDLGREFVANRLMGLRDCGFSGCNRIFACEVIIAFNTGSENSGELIIFLDHWINLQ